MHSFPIDQWTAVEISQKADSNGVYEYAIKIDNVEKYSMTNTQPESFTDVKVYTSDPWNPAANAIIRNLSYGMNYYFTYRL